MQKIFLLFLFTGLFTSCSKDETNFEADVGLNPPVVILTSIELPISQPDAEPFIVDIQAPWLAVTFDFVNNNSRVVTIIAATAVVTGPDGVSREVNIQNRNFDTGEIEPYFALVRPEADTDCNGVVGNEGPAPATCGLDEQNPSYIGRLIYISDIMSGFSDGNTDSESGESFNQFRGTSFNFEVRLTGWFGNFDDPQDNFYKVFYFTGTTN